MTAMCCSLFDFALSSNCYVDSLNDVCSRINMGLRAALIKGRKRSLLQAVWTEILYKINSVGLDVRHVFKNFPLFFYLEDSDKASLRGVKLYTC